MPKKFCNDLASDVPVLNNYPGWLSEMITTNECGVAVPPENPEAFADALQDLADHPEKRLQMGRQARALGEREFSRDLLANRFVDWLETTRKPHTETETRSRDVSASRPVSSPSRGTH